MAIVPGEFPMDAPLVEPATNTNGPEIRFEFVWQGLGSVSQYVDDNGWQSYDMPSIMHSLPENIVVGQLLQNILKWSVTRLEIQTEEQFGSRALAEKVANSHDMRSLTEQEQRSKPTPTDHLDDREISTILASTKTRKAQPLLARLKQIRQEIAAKVMSRDQQGNASSAASSESAGIVSQHGECISCFEEFPQAELIHTKCSHDYCKTCLHEVVLNSMKTESAFPPKCCLSEIPLNMVLVCLNKKERNQYKEKSAEYAIPAGHRWYCPEPRCTKWIRPERLHRVRRSHQTCPHCKVAICSTCRSLAHDDKESCPQDFGLQSTLEVAESEGWRRCYSCRTMVELTDGCRHITCRCGAEFCYVCNARWRTCSCTETDKEARMQKLRTRREERDRKQQEEDAAAQAEEDDIAVIIAQVMEFERKESIRLAEEEERRRLEEELQLALLEETRLLEEISRKEAQEKAEQQLRRALNESSKDQCQELMKVLMQIINFQHAVLDSEHQDQEQSCTSADLDLRTLAVQEAATTASLLQENIDKRRRRLDSNQREEWAALLSEAEELEDDMFLQMHMYFRDKPNREQREMRMKDELRKQQSQKQDDLKARYETKQQKLELDALYEIEGIKKADSTRHDHLEQQSHATLTQLGRQIGADRHWFQLVSTRRIEMMRKHKILVLQQLEMDEEPIGLTEQQAARIEPAIPKAEDMVEPEEDTVEEEWFWDPSTEPSQPPPPIPIQTEDSDNSSSYDNSWGRIQFAETSTCPLPQHNSPETHGISSFAGPERNVQSIPGAYLDADVVETRNATELKTKGSTNHYLAILQPPSSKNRSASSSKQTFNKTGAMSMSGITTMSFMIDTAFPHNNSTQSQDNEQRITSTPSIWGSPSTGVADRTNRTVFSMWDNADAHNKESASIRAGQSSMDSGIMKKKGFFGRIKTKTQDECL